MRRLLLVACPVAALILATVPAHGTTPGRNGQIVYARFPSLWIVDADGTGEHKLPWIKRSEANNPDWSPDGKRIVFDRCAAKCEIWTIDADGRNQRRLGPDCLRKTGACQDRGFPAWSPDGKRIAFGGSIGALREHRVEYAELYVMNADGSGARRLTHLSEGAKPFSVDIVDPAWSPDGKHLVFDVQHFATADPPNRRALFVVDSDGSDPPAAHAVEPQRGRQPRLVPGRQPDPVPDRLDHEPASREPPHDSPRRLGPDQAHRLSVAEDRPHWLVLARREVDRVRPLQRDAVSGALRHAPRTAPACAA